MSGLPNAESVHQVMTEQRIVAGSVEEKAAIALRERKASEALSIAAGRQPDANMMKMIADQNFGNTNPDGTKNRQAGSAAERRFDDVSKQIDRLDLFHKVDFNRLPLAEKNYVLSHMTDALLTHPAMRAHFSSFPGGGRAEALALAQKFAHNGHFRDKVKNLMLEKGDVTQLLEDEVSAAEVERQRLEQEKNNLNTQKRNQQREIDDNQRSLREYTPQVIDSRGAPPRPGRFFDEVQTARRDQIAAEGRLALANADLTALERRKNALETEKRHQDIIDNGGTLPRGAMIPRGNAGLIEADLLQANADIAARRTDQVSASQDVEANKQRIKSLEETKSNLEKNLREKMEQLKDTNNSLSEIEKDLLDKSMNVIKARAKKEIAEEKFANGLMNVFEDATNQMVEEDLQRAIEDTQKAIDAMQEQQAEEAALETDNNIKQYKEYASKRWIDGSRKNKIMNDVIAQDYKVLMGETPYEFTFTDGSRMILNGPEKLLLNVMEDSGLPVTQIESLLKNKDFVEEQSIDIAEKAMSYQLFTGKISRGDAIAIQQSTWGANMIEKALSRRDNIQGSIDQALGKGILNWSGARAEGIRRLTGKQIFTLLALVAGIGLTVASGGLFGAGKNLGALGLAAGKAVW